MLNALDLCAYKHFAVEFRKVVFYFLLILNYTHDKRHTLAVAARLSLHLCEFANRKRTVPGENIITNRL